MSQDNREEKRSRYGEETDKIGRDKGGFRMADVQLNAALAVIRGRVGDVVFKKRNGKLYISRRPDFSKRKLSAAQKESVARFRAAVRYAQRVLANPQERMPFERAVQKPGKTLYNSIIADYLNRQT